MVSSNIEKSGTDTGAIGQQICDPPLACVHCLAASALTAELTDSEITALFKVVDIRRLSKGEVLISEGEQDDRIYAIARGEFEVARGESADREVQLTHLRPGTIAGELAFLDGLKRTATVRAATDGACAIALRRKDLESMLTANPTIPYRIMTAAIRSAHRTVGKMDAVHLDMIRYIQG